MERLRSESHQKPAERQVRINELKPKLLKNRIGEMSQQMPTDTGVSQYREATILFQNVKTLALAANERTLAAIDVLPKTLRTLIHFYINRGGTPSHSENSSAKWFLLVQRVAQANSFLAEVPHLDAVADKSNQNFKTRLHYLENVYTHTSK